jgi:transposase
LTAPEARGMVRAFDPENAAMSRTKTAKTPRKPLRSLMTNRTFYDRLRRAGKPFKVAITACMRKLLTTLNAMIHNSTRWNSTDA